MGNVRGVAPDVPAHTDLPVTVLESDPRLAAWREGVGRPVTVDLPTAPPAPARWSGTLLVIGWNLWIGRGHLDAVLAQVPAGAPETPLVLLVQEAYRAGDTVPDGSFAAGAVDFSRRAFPERDIVAVARHHGFALCYAPSMRNASHRSDRGNAILSTLPLEDAHAWELPLALQRRVAVAATVRLPDGNRLRVCTAHLDPRGGSVRDLLGLAGRAAQAGGLRDRLAGDTVPTVLGADLNLARGRREAAFRLLAEAGFRHGVPEKPPAWPHTYHRVPRLLLDWLLVRDPASAVAGMAIERLDEHPRDRGPYVFGSDHHPLVATIAWRPRDRGVAG